jgi:DUF971 family protein
MTEHHAQKVKEPGVIVWDQQGLVVVWPDQHPSCFTWEALRSFCLCAECREQHAGQQSVSQHLDSPRGDTVGHAKGREFDVITRYKQGASRCWADGLG